MSKPRCHRWLSLAGKKRPGSRSRSHLFPLFALVLFLPAAFTAVYAQDQTAQALTERSAIVVRGKVLKVNASDEPMASASPSTVVISVEQMYAGKEIAGDLRGRTATVILKRPGSVKAGEDLLFFGNPRFLGRSLTIADEGELSVEKGTPAMLSDSEASAHARKDKAVRERLATANIVFRGTVESVHPLETEAGRPASEHDPEWRVTNVKITTALRGGQAGEAVLVLFPASRDITWFNAPKLKEGQDAVFLAHPFENQDARLSRNRSFAALREKQPVYFVTEPFDVLPPSYEDHLRELLSSSKETKQ